MIKHLKPRTHNELPKYHIIDFRDIENDGCERCFWVPERMENILNYLDEKYPDYEYCDMITNGNGNFHEFIILKLK
jgi:hypothetical protein